MELICVLSKKPKVCLAREENGWVICSGFRRSKTGGGKEHERAVDPGYYGDKLGAALKAAYRRIVRGRARPDSTIHEIYELCASVAEEMEARVERFRGADQRCPSPPDAPGGSRNRRQPKKRLVTGRVSPGQGAGTAG